ncbi:MAG: hypothetical protein JJE47_07500 [Acidimicrobiia bacterium]|nr:hypothetical protein [Acidimicrobiia bacterium]
MTGEVATWRMVIAVSVVTGLAVSLGVVAWAGGPKPGSDEGLGNATTIPGATTPLSSAPRSTSTVLSDASIGDAVRVGVREALTAWGRFAGSGDLADVEEFFDPHGPQWSVFEEEAGLVGTSFMAEVEEESLTIDGRSAAFVASITFVAGGGESLRAKWEIELRPDPDGRWLIWSVRDLADG